MSEASDYDEDDGLIDCSWCGGVGSDECDDPIQCLNPECDGRWCRCSACNGRGHSQVVW